ncbi:PREDICTED: neuralized-like protein 4, partial [Nanorana parkeri]|uniref:neuralized-like protein 4 n=1 Tax=Nanorana parkeri TaxID=125878 RepID=UPI000854422B
MAEQCRATIRRRREEEGGGERKEAERGRGRKEAERGRRRREGVHAVLDLHGFVSVVSVVSSSVLEESDITKPPSVTSESDEEEDIQHNGDPVLALQPHSLQFLGNHGKNILLSHGNRTATRVCSYNQGIVVLAQPLPRLFLFQVRIDQLSPRWTSSLSIGVIGVSAERLNFPATAAAMKRSAWIFQRGAVLCNGAKVTPIMCDPCHGGDPVLALQPHSLQFLGNHGKNILLSHGNRTATRVCSYNQGIVVLAQPLPRLFLFQVRIDQLSPRWTSSLSIGVIGVSAERLNFPATAAAMKRSAWIFQRGAVLCNGAKVTPIMCDPCHG